MKNSTPKRNVRVGVFRRIAEADAAVEKLAQAGFAKDHITVICPTCAPDRYQDYVREEPAGSHAASAAAGGGAIGAILGGLAAVAGLTATGGLGIFVVGPLVAGAGGGAVAGGFIGAMLSRGFDDEVANYYDQALQKGRVLVAVEAHEEGARALLERAERVFAELGAEPIPLREG